MFSGAAGQGRMIVGRKFQGAAMFAVGQRLAGAIRRSGLPCEGVNLFVPDGEVAGQEVMHIHLHVLPRTPGDGFRIERGSAIRGRAELDQAAAIVRGGLTWQADRVQSVRPSGTDYERG